MGIEQEPVSAEELYDTAIKLVKDLTPTLENVNFDSTGASVMPYGYDELAEKINDAYEKYAASADFVSHFDSYPKPIALSKPMTYTHIAGVYTFMTGEANINTNYPDFIRPFTVAHEMSHQRGIAREEEANFMAFLVCIGSDDDYVRYGAYADVLNYVLNALYKADTQLYAKVRALMPQELKNEFISYSEYFIAYSDSTASKISGAINDTFLHSQGQSEGVNSYGLVVDLAVAYYKSIKD